MSTTTRSIPADLVPVLQETIWREMECTADALSSAITIGPKSGMTEDEAIVRVQQVIALRATFRDCDLDAVPEDTLRAVVKLALGDLDNQFTDSQTVEEARESVRTYDALEALLGRVTA